MSDIIVIGAGQAGCTLCAKLRDLGFDGSITLIGEEPSPPYQRPPLSKAYLLGDMTKERLYLRPLDFYEEHRINLRLGNKVNAIDPAGKTVTLGDEALSYDKLALTTGSVARRLPPAIGGDLEGAYVVRTLSDVDSMADEFDANRRVLIVGGGYIGLEAAAVAAKKGLNVTLVEMSERILQRVAAPQTSEYFRNLHATHGVEIIEGTGLKHLTGERRVSGAQLDDGRVVETDFVIVGVGIAPATKLAEEAGLAIENGIRTDVKGQTSDPAIWAAGDCTSFPFKGSRIRLESVPNAIDQAEIVAENMLGAGKDYIAKPWFWSDQYDVKLQIAGLNAGYDRVFVRPGEKDGAVSHWYYRGETLLAVDAMNDPRAYMIGKRLIEAGKSPAPAVIEDSATDLKALMRG